MNNRVKTCIASKTIWNLEESGMSPKEAKAEAKQFCKAQNSGNFYKRCMKGREYVRPKYRESDKERCKRGAKEEKARIKEEKKAEAKSRKEDAKREKAERKREKACAKLIKLRDKDVKGAKRFAVNVLGRSKKSIGRRNSGGSFDGGGWHYSNNRHLANKYCTHGSAKRQDVCNINVTYGIGSKAIGILRGPPPPTPWEQAIRNYFGLQCSE